MKFTLLNLILVLAALVPCPAAGTEALVISSCVGCHEDGKRMAELGYPHFTVTRDEVRRQSGMPASCPDCHRGNPSSGDQMEAHQGMGRLLVVRKQGLVLVLTLDEQKTASFSRNLW